MPQFHHPKPAPKSFWIEPEESKHLIQAPETPAPVIWRGFDGPQEVVQVPETITTSPNLKALDLDLVPKAPKVQSGPSPSVVSSGENAGEVFLIDAPEKENGSCFLTLHLIS